MQGLSCPGQPVFWNWNSVVSLEFWRFRSQKHLSKIITVTAFSHFSGPVAQVPAKQCGISACCQKMGDSIVILYSISSNQGLRRRNSKPSTYVICRSDSFIHLFLPTSPLPYTFSISLLVDPLILSHPVLCSSSLLWTPSRTKCCCPWHLWCPVSSMWLKDLVFLAPLLLSVCSHRLFPQHPGARIIFFDFLPGT